VQSAKSSLDGKSALASEAAVWLARVLIGLLESVWQI
jgi:hypothetical protein